MVLTTDSLLDALDKEEDSLTIHEICRNLILNKVAPANELYNLVEGHESLWDDRYFDEMCEGVMDSLTGWCSARCSLLNLSDHVYKAKHLHYNLGDKQ